MSPEVIAAIVAGFFGLLAGLMPHFIDKKRESAKRHRLRDASFPDFAGLWTGEMSQAIGPGGKPMKAQVTVKIIPEGSGVIGAVYISYKVAENQVPQFWDYDLEGIIRSARYACLIYDSYISDRIAFGVCFVELAATGELKGILYGYGPDSKKAVEANLRLLRQRRLESEEIEAILAKRKLDV